MKSYFQRVALLFLASLIISGTVLPSIHASTETNLIANPSFETYANNQPQSWSHNAWGANNASFSYLDDGHTGNKSVKTEVTIHDNGDAKWYFPPTAVEESKTYSFTDYYQSDVQTKAVVWYSGPGVSDHYAQLGVLPTSTSWSQARFQISIPAGYTKASVFHLVDQVGWLIIDDVSLSADNVPDPDPEPTPDPEPSPDPTPDPEPVPGPPADEDGLVSNPSVENSVNNKPSNWQNNSWGGNASAFTFVENGAHSGDKSIKTEITSYTDGDAKWYFNPVTVDPGKTYKYVDYYKSNITSRVVIRYTDSNGNYTYRELGTLQPGSQWQKYEVKFTTLSNTSDVSVFHLIDHVGWLQVDDANVFAEASPDPDPTTPPSNDGGFIPNPSVETSNGNKPQNWTNNQWGTNTSNFEYMNEGHTGNRSVKVTTSNYQSGDAKWYFEPISTLQPGSQYRFSTWYKTNTIPHAVAMLIMADGSEQYFGLPDPEPNSTSNWQYYTDSFSVPPGTVATSVFLFVSSNGYVQTDDYSIVPYSPEGFDRPLLTLTFDDGHEDNTSTALPLLDEYGFKTTQCYATQFLEGQPDYVIENVLAFVAGGHEICSHTVTHPFLTQLSPSEVNYELEHSQEYLQNLTGQQIVNFASPFGDYNEAVNESIKDYYRAHRTVDEGYNSKDNFEPYRLRVQNMLSTTTLSEFHSWLDKANEDHTWLILVYHRVAEYPEEYDTYVSDFAQQLQAISESGIVVKTFNGALDEATAQIP